MPIAATNAKMSLHALEFAERRARYAFLSELLDGADALEILAPGTLREPGADFLTSLGAQSARTVFVNPGKGDLGAAIDAFASSLDDSSQPLVILDDGLSWLSPPTALDALLKTLGDAPGKAAGRARFAICLRNPAGTSLAALDGASLATQPAARFRFPDIEQALANRFDSIAFATQSPLFGSQLAPLTREGEELDCAVDGRLNAPGAAAFFIALCAQTQDALPSMRELTLVPLDPRPLSRCAGRFARMADDLARAEADKSRAESLLTMRRDEKRRLDELERQFCEANAARSEWEARCQKAEAKASRTEALLDELAGERTKLIAENDKANAQIAALQSAREASEAAKREAEAAMEAAQRERQAHLQLARTATDRLQARVRELETALEAEELKSRQVANEPRAKAKKEKASAAQVAAQEQLKRELETQAARIEALDRLVGQQDARLEAFEAMEQKLALAHAEQVQLQARASEMEAKLIERSFLVEALAEEVCALDQAVSALAKKRNGRAIEALLELHARLSLDRPTEAIEQARAEDATLANQTGDIDGDEDEEDDEEAMF